MSVIELKSARDRILDAASARYYAEGIRAVSADKLIADAQVSKVTFYRHFPTKADLVTAYLTLRCADERDAWEAEQARRPDDAAGLLRWYVAAVGQVSCAPGFRGCAFINAAAELPDDDHPGRRLITEHRAWLVAAVAGLLRASGVAEPARRSEQLMMLRDGAMVSGYLGRRPEEISAALVAAVDELIDG